MKSRTCFALAAAVALSLSCAGAGAEAGEEIMRMIPDDALIVVNGKNMSGALSEYLNSPDTKKRISEMLEKAGKGIAIYNKYVESGEKEAAENMPTLEKITAFKDLFLSVLESLDSLGAAAFYADGKPLAVFWTDAESLDKILGRLKRLRPKRVCKKVLPGPPTFSLYTGEIGEIQRFSPIAGAYVHAFFNLLGNILRSDAESVISLFSAMNPPPSILIRGNRGRARQGGDCRKEKHNPHPQERRISRMARLHSRRALQLHNKIHPQFRKRDI